MMVCKNEIRINGRLLTGWTLALALMMGLCILVYPDLSRQNEQMNEMFSSMGAFSAAFGLDTLHFGSYDGYFGVECGNVIGLGGGLFAAVLGISMTSKEEERRITEFYLAAPISRLSFFLQKLCALVLMIVVMNLVLLLVVLVGSWMIKEAVTVEMLQLMAAMFWMQVDIGLVCTGLSAFLRHASMPFGLCIALGFYFLNLAANLVPDGSWIKYVTPYGFTDAGWIYTHNNLDWRLVGSNTLIALVILLAGGWYFRRKDLFA